MTRSKDLFNTMRQKERDEQPDFNLALAPPAKESYALTLSSKKLLNFTKSDISDLARTIVQEVKDGNEDLLETMISVKKAVSFFEQLDENLRPMFYGKNICSKGEVLKQNNVEIEQADFSKWDYSGCNDEILIRLTEEKKEREMVLKLITKPTEFIDEVTGSQYTANPAIKRTTSGFKISVNP